MNQNMEWKMNMSKPEGLDTWLNIKACVNLKIPTESQKSKTGSKNFAQKEANSKFEKENKNLNDTLWSERREQEEVLEVLCWLQKK